MEQKTRFATSDPKVPPIRGLWSANIVREKQQPQPLEGELMSVEDVCKLLGKSKSAVYRTVRCHDIPFIRQGNRLYFDRPTIKKWLEKKQNIECITNMEEFEKFMTPDPWRYRNRR